MMSGISEGESDCGCEGIPVLIRGLKGCFLSDLKLSKLFDTKGRALAGAGEVRCWAAGLSD